MKLISTDEAAERLGVSGRRVRQMIDEGKLSAQYVGGGYVIDESMLNGVKTYGKAGRPPGKFNTANKVSSKSASRRAATRTAAAKKRGEK